ncbi:MAG: 4-hydroxy-3-methylbut-2-enyl diphosphate reductase [Kiritimatiellae bacterium]|nr:4-hydroxy-3-methylbut-2-enyl diphosphate reductase [Kiritimatiellia bacterium]
MTTVQSDRTVILASPRGFCAGVAYAVEIAETVLRRRAHPVYALKEIVHNHEVTRSLEAKGLRFIQTIGEAPVGSTVLFGAHGVAPAVRQAAAARRLEVIDATCPFVSKVHAEAQRFARRNCAIILIGHRRHDEVVGVAGEAPAHVTVIENEAEAEAFRPADPGRRVAVITQTTLSQAETDRVMAVLRRRFDDLLTPAKADICYATTNRQEAVRQLARRAPFILVLGSANSSNTNRLVEVAATAGAEAHLLSDRAELNRMPLGQRMVIGLTAGASTPESFIVQVLEDLKCLGFNRVEELEVAREHTHFPLPAAFQNACP